MGLNLLSDVLNSVLTQRLGNKITINPPGHVACNVPKICYATFYAVIVHCDAAMPTGHRLRKQQISQKESKRRATEQRASANN